jgi:hypothetical protein
MTRTASHAKAADTHRYKVFRNRHQPITCARYDVSRQSRGEAAMSADCNDEIFLAPESIIADLLVMTSIREDNAMGDGDDAPIPAAAFNGDDVEAWGREAAHPCDFEVE